MTVPVLLLFADTGGGHRSAAWAVADALEHEFPGVFAPLLYDPLCTTSSPRLLRWIVELYGPIVRFAPWAWGALYHALDSQLAATLLRRTLLRLADAPVAQVVTARNPVAILSFHPLTTAAAVRAVRHHPESVRVATVITDLATIHATWRYNAVDRIVVPSEKVRQRCEEDGIAPECCVNTGLPVARTFSHPQISGHQRRILRRRLGVDARRFLVLLTGGAEGTGGIAAKATAIIDAFDDIDIVAMCGRNRGLKRRLDQLNAGRGPRLKVNGFVDNMADWYRAVDVVVTKAGPQTIAEATCCGAALLVTSHLPGQERGNTEEVVNSGAGLYTPRLEDLISAVAHLRSHPDVLQAMRRASLEMARPTAAREVASVVAELTSALQMRLERHGVA
jgi:1,2-diacylglycerol 3-beta-galactosyltransferase